MKKRVITVVFFSILISCKKEAPTAIETQDATLSPKEVAVAQEWYQGVLGKDTITLMLSRKENQVLSGNLRYQFFEKDNNQGTLTGEIKGDTLFLEYRFMSEGMTLIREVAFLKQGDIYIEGYAETQEKDGIIRFKNRKSLEFNSAIHLEPVSRK